MPSSGHASLEAPALIIFESSPKGFIRFKEIIANGDESQETRSGLTLFLIAKDWLTKSEKSPIPKPWWNRKRSIIHVEVTLDY